jgi:CBS domain-containing protein
MRLELVRDWMSREVITITPEKPPQEARSSMLDRKIRRLPVVEENGRLVGIITLSDIREEQPPNLTINDLMRLNPITISENATVGEAAETMLAHTISGLPVLDAQGQLVGIITESDIFRLVVHGWRHHQGDPPQPYTRYNQEPQDPKGFRNP